MCLKRLTSRSHTPPWRSSLGILKFQFMLFFTSESANAYLFQLGMLFGSWSSVAMKLAPLSDQATTVTPRRATNLEIPMTQLLLFIDKATWKRTARVVRRLKKILTVFLSKVYLKQRKVESNRSGCWWMEEIFKRVFHEGGQTWLVWKFPLWVCDM